MVQNPTATDASRHTENNICLEEECGLGLVMARPRAECHILKFTNGLFKI